MTGIVATMPYIALQLVGMEVVIGALGFPAGGLRRPSAAHHRLRRPCRLHLYERLARAGPDRRGEGHADLRDDLRRRVIIPAKLGGYGAIFASVPQEKLILPSPTGDNLGLYSAYATLALGSALALFLYPHAMTGS